MRAVVIVTAFFSYPFLTLIDRANIEGLVWILLFLGLAAFVRERFFLAATFLGVATAMKIFPIVLFLLFVPRRRYKALAAAAGVAGAVTVAALIGIGPTLPQAARGIVSGLMYLGRLHALQIRPGELNFEHSLFSSLKWAARLEHHDVATSSA